MSYKPILRISFLGWLFALQACQNYTTSPVCTAANKVAVPGTSGVYTVSVQTDEFAVTTETITVSAKAESAQLQISRGSGTAQESTTCQVGGYLIAERYDPLVKAYAQDRLYVTGMGLTALPLFYDKAALESDGVKSKLIAVPAEVNRTLGYPLPTRLEGLAARLSSVSDTSPGLLIDNSNIAAAALVRRSHASSAGLTLLRQ